MTETTGPRPPADASSRTTVVGRWSRRGHRVALIGGAVFVLAATGAAAAGVAPWQDAPRPSLDLAAGSAHGDSASGTTLVSVVGDPGTGRDRAADGPSTSASTSTGPVTSSPTQPNVPAGAPTTGEPSTSATPTSLPATSEPPVATAAPLDPPSVPPTSGEVATEPVPPTTAHHEPHTTSEPAPVTVSVTAPADTTPEPSTTDPSTTAAHAPTTAASDPTTATTAAPATPAQPTSTEAPPTTAEEHHAPATLSLSCSQSGDAGSTSVDCHWSGTVPSGFTRYLVLRGQVGGRGRVVFSSSDPAAGGYLDQGLEAGQYSYVVVELDSANQTLGHSNLVPIVVPGAGG